MAVGVIVVVAVGVLDGVAVAVSAGSGDGGGDGDGEGITGVIVALAAGSDAGVLDAAGTPMVTAISVGMGCSGAPHPARVSTRKNACARLRITDPQARERPNRRHPAWRHAE